MTARRPHGHWPEARAYYVEGADTDGTRTWPRLADVAERHAIPPDTVRKRAAREGWTAARDAFRAAFERRRREQRLDTLVRASAAFDDAFVRSTAKMAALIEREVAALSNADDRTAPAHLLTVARAMLAVQRAGKVALGETTDHTAVELPSGVFTFVGGPRAVDLDAGEGDDRDDGEGA